MKAEMVEALVQNKAFINGVVALGCILVIVRFLGFIKAQWREGLNPHLLPCPQCGRRLSPQAYFCPGCGQMLETGDDTMPKASLAVRPALLGTGPIAPQRRRRLR